MCGIAGKVDFTEAVDPGVIVRMCAAMKHRGPNARGTWSNGCVALGMQRLSIIDVQGGDQPIFNEDGSVAVVMNGEIYNFQELRAQLIRDGHVFATRSDTEVLVHLYEDHGAGLVDHLRGMFAFAIWDARRRRLVLGRDRVGKKPLFLARRGGTVWFASELMALLQDPDISRAPNQQAIATYLALQYVPHPMSAFEGIEKLAPATTLSIDEAGSESRRYWSLSYETPAVPPSAEELAERLRDLLWEATRIRLVSEVPLGAFLSGGIDSSAVVAAMSDQVSGPVKTFSIGFPDEAFDEVRFARMVANQFSTDHHEFIVEPQALEIMPTLARHYGEPFADPSAIPSFYLAEMTSQHVTVALNGDGGDESFAGYSRYLGNRFAARADWLPASVRRMVPIVVRPLGSGGQDNSTRARLQRIARVLPMERDGRYAHWMSAFPRFMRDEMLQPEFLAATSASCAEDVIGAAWAASDARSPVDRMLDTDVNTYLPDDLLVKMDIATMAYSVEGRSPFLDHPLMEFAAALPAELKLQGRNGKALLKTALRGILPDDVLYRPKMGFGVPLRRWFRHELRALPAELLMASDSRVHAYVKPEAISRMIAAHQGGGSDHSLRLWVLLQLELWHREVVESCPISGDSSSVALTAGSAQ